MTNPTVWLCPVCWREVKPTIHGNLARHFDAIRSSVCPAGGEPFRITIAKQPEFSAVVA